MHKIQISEPDIRQRPRPEPGPLAVLFEDAAVLVLDKPAGLVVHPTYKNLTGTLLNFVLWHLRDDTETQPGILTRLDKQTSGIVLLARTAPLHAVMQRDMHAGHVRKEYLALVEGTPHPAAGRIVLPLGRDTGDRRRVVVREDGQASETLYEVLEAAARSLVRCELVTGRTHQIRVHLAERGWPVVGDPVYGTPDTAIVRQALHAWRVTFPHPVTRQPFTVTAPLPADIRDLLPRTTLEQYAL